MSRFGDRQYHLMEKGTRKQKKAKEMLFSALQDDYSINPVTETETVDFITEKERELEILFCELWDEKRHPHYDVEDWVDLHGYIMDEIREEIFSIYNELSYIK